jgi:hypothetical protein
MPSGCRTRRWSRAGWRIPDCQHFTGETFFQHRPPIDPSSLTRWRNRIGEAGVEWLLTKTIEAGKASGAVEEKSLERVAVDTTVMEKAIAHPTDARLYERARSKLVALARAAGIGLRQTYNRLGPAAVRPGRALRPCSAVQADAQGGADSPVDCSPDERGSRATPGACARY